jgi:E3 ubiquitin-protein ligase HUWE1
MQLVDNVLYSFSNAFQLFANARGVEILVDRIEVIVQLLSNVHLRRTALQYEIDFNIKEYAHEQRSREMYGSYGEYRARVGDLCLLTIE